MALAVITLCFLTMPADTQRYCLISPCRDEAQYIERTLESVARQTIQPALWIVVDDGSSDATPEILKAYQDRLPFLRVVTRTNRGARKVGGGVVQAFNDGLAEVELNDFDYICKLDVDLELPPRYFEGLIGMMEADSCLGTCSGKPYFLSKSGKRVYERCGDENSVGMTKFYRVDCFRDIGGFVSEVMWDGIDCHRCRMLGWRATANPAEDMSFQHLRAMGSSQVGILTGRARHGFGQYFMGSSFSYVLASAIYRLGDHPWALGSAAIVWGYVRAWASGKNRYQDREFVDFVRAFQRDCLLRGKRVAVMAAEKRSHVPPRPHFSPQEIAGVRTTHASK